MLNTCVKTIDHTSTLIGWFKDNPLVLVVYHYHHDRWGQNNWFYVSYSTLQHISFLAIKGGLGRI